MAVFKFRDPETNNLITIDIPLGHHYFTTEYVIGSWINDKPLYEIVSKQPPTQNVDEILSERQMGEYTVYQYTKNS